MTDDDLLREASDPTIGAERIDELWQASQEERWTGEVVSALLRNPSVSPDTLYRWLSGHMEAWENPRLPLLLLEQPNLIRLAEIALDVEAWSTDIVDDGYPRRLADQIALWIKWSPENEHEVRIKAFARHLAGLFSLPWPEEP